MDNQKTNFQLNKLPKKSFEITADIDLEEINKAKDEVLDQQGKGLEIKGFRKGMAPKKVVAETLGKEKIIRLVLERVLPGIFQKAVEELKLKPILSPKIEVLSAEEAKPWQVKFTSCEEPEIDLGSFKEEIKKAINAGAKIWTPGEGTKEEKPTPQEEKEKKINLALEWLIKNVKVEVSDLLLEDEVGRKLSGLIDQTQKLDISIDQYLASMNKTTEQIREEYAKQAQESLAFEFILGKIADNENIKVTEEDLTKSVAQAKTEEEKKALESQKYYLAILLRRQKTLDFLANL